MELKNTYHSDILGNQKKAYLDILLLSLILSSNIILFLLIPNTFNEHFLKRMAVLSILQLVINIFALLKFNEKIFSLPVLFLFFSWVFHYGNIIIYGFNLNNGKAFYLLNSVPVDVILDSITFAFYTQSFVAFGMFLILLHNKGQRIVANFNSTKEEEYLFLIRNIGFILIFIGIVPTLYIDMGKLYLFFTSGYVSTYTLNQNGILVILHNVFRVGIFLLIIGYKNRKSIALRIFVFAVIYQVIIMLSGNRGGAIVEIIGLFYIYTNIIQKIKLKNIMPYGFIAYFIIILLNTLSKFRLISSPSLQDFFIAFWDSFQESPILTVLSEFGGTLITVCYSLMFFSGNENIPFGTNYLFSFLGAFPNIMGLFNEVHKNAVYVSHFPPSYRTFLGGSYIGELYYSFKILGIPFSTLIGMFIAILSIKIKESIVQKRYILFSIYMFIFCDILWWIRGYFIEVVMYPIWVSLVIFTVYSFLSKKGSKPSKHNKFEIMNR